MCDLRLLAELMRDSMAAPSHQHRRADKKKYIDQGTRGLPERRFPVGSCGLMLMNKTGGHVSEVGVPSRFSCMELIRERCRDEHNLGEAAVKDRGGL